MNNSALRFNIRVYFLCLRNAGREVLVCTESVMGRSVTKFPGGGLEWGEGTLDCLHREALEELGRPVKVLRHFYTTDFFQPSAFSERDQIISIYYLVELENENGTSGPVFPSPEPGLLLSWLPITDLHPDRFTLPIDKHVAALACGTDKLI